MLIKNNYSINGETKKNGNKNVKCFLKNIWKIISVF